MSANANLSVVPSAPVRRGFAAACLNCGEKDAVSIDLHDCTTFKCAACDCELSITDVKAMVSAWMAVLSWVELAPVLPE